MRAYFASLFRRQSQPINPLLEESITCQISGCIFLDPITLPSGNSIERAEAKKLLGKTDPYNPSLSFEYNDQIPTNRALRGVVDQYLKDHPDAKKRQYGYKEPEANAATALIAHPQRVYSEPEQKEGEEISQPTIREEGAQEVSFINIKTLDECISFLSVSPYSFIRGCAVALLIPGPVFLGFGSLLWGIGANSDCSTQSDDYDYDQCMDDNQRYLVLGKWMVGSVLSSCLLLLGAIIYHFKQKLSADEMQSFKNLGAEKLDINLNQSRGQLYKEFRKVTKQAEKILDVKGLNKCIQFLGKTSRFQCGDAPLSPKEMIQFKALGAEKWAEKYDIDLDQSCGQLLKEFKAAKQKLYDEPINVTRLSSVHLNLSKSTHTDSVLNSCFITP